MAAEVTLYNRSGRPVAYVVDDGSIYLWSGHAVAYLDGDKLYGWNGKHLGWIIDGVLYDENGRRIGFQQGHLPVVAQVSPVKSVKSVRSVRSVRQMARFRPTLSLSMSDHDLQDFLSRGKH